jgi:hypothetical protein
MFTSGRIGLLMSFAENLERQVGHLSFWEGSFRRRLMQLSQNICDFEHMTRGLKQRPLELK